MNKADFILPITIDTIEKLSNKMVSAQVDIERMINTLEETYKYKIARPVECEVNYHPYSPRRLHIVSPIFPPKIQINVYKAKYYGNPYLRREAGDVWRATLGKMYRENKSKCADLKDFRKAIIWFTYFYPNKVNFNVNNQMIRLIIYAIKDYFLPCAKDNRAITIIVDSAIDEKKPRTEIMIIEDLGQLKTLRHSNPFEDFTYNEKEETTKMENEGGPDTTDYYDDTDEEFFQP